MLDLLDVMLGSTETAAAPKAVAAGRRSARPADSAYYDIAGRQVREFSKARPAGVYLVNQPGALRSAA
jgi:hypothetical protein